MAHVFDVVLVSSLLLLVLAKALSVPPEFGVPASFAAALASALRLM